MNGWTQIQQEWLNSASSPEITRLNVKYLTGDTPREYLLYALPEKEWRCNNATVRTKYRQKYAHTEHGGWWCGTVDVLAANEGINRKSEWGCFKPFQPRFFCQNGKTKVLKYEHPPQAPTELFALSVPYSIGLKIASRYGLGEEYTKRLALVTNLADEDPGFWRWVIEHPQIPLIITEGAKKAACLLSAGYVAIALPGIFNGYRSPKDEFGKKIWRASFLIPQLEVFAKPGRQIYFAFDQDTKPKTVTNVNTAIKNTGKLLQRKGCSVKVITWNPTRKGVDDLIFNCGREEFDSAFAAAIPFKKWQFLTNPKLTKLAEKICREYVGDLSVYLEGKEQYFLAIRSPKGTGKTESLSAIVEAAKRTGQKIIILTHRVQLGQALCERYGIDYVSELRNSETKGVFGYGLCVDSLHPKSQANFNPEQWQDALVIIDEVEQVLWHLVNSSTCIKNRAAILENFYQLIRQTLVSPIGKLIIADADLTDDSINLLSSLVGECNPIIIDNGFIPRGYTSYVYGGNDPTELINQLMSAIASGEKPLVLTSAQKVKSTYSSQNLERIIREKFPDLKVLRIDGETVAEKGHKAEGIIPNLNQELPLYDVVIASPSIETGVSIDVRGHFTSVWGIFQGVQSTDSVRQALMRLRELVPRHIWVRKVAVTASTIKKNKNRIMISQQNQAEINTVFLADAGATNIDSDCFSEALHFWAKKSAQISHEAFNYRDTVLAGLELEGNIIIPAEEFLSKQEKLEVKAELKATKESAYTEYCETVVKAEDVTENEYKRLKDKRSHSAPERLQLKKAELKHRYRVDITPELVRRDEEGLYTQLRLLYYATSGKEYLKQRDAKKIESWLRSCEGKVFRPDYNRGLLTAKVKVLEKLLSVGDFLNYDREWRNSDGELQHLGEIVQKCRLQIENVLGFKISKSATPIRALSQILSNCFDLSLKKIGRDATGSRERVYQLQQPPELARQILTAWREWDESFNPSTEVGIQKSQSLETLQDKALSPSTEDNNISTSTPCGRDSDEWDEGLVTALANLAKYLAVGITRKVSSVSEELRWAVCDYLPLVFKDWEDREITLFEAANEIFLLSEIEGFFAALSLVELSVIQRLRLFLSLIPPVSG
ncbi:MAG: plasmid replication protein, CyRepA1 family [Oscillatoria sp. PMC 1051.18]|nr:plasmid replication protein, CyRepA1 family [Oscillatoria sp. PMC 1050.18]MEC5032116.1 plasmid replication protein, CyRepA1 family [Oscillatoria sp. PMC 1051.18]